MNRQIFFVLVLIFCCSSIGMAQEIASSFRVGLNFASITGPSEVGTDGNNLESFKTTTGFHVAGGAVFKFLENYGMKAELVYSQEGGTYEYDGPTSQVFRTTLNGNPIRSTGTQAVAIRVSNSYLRIPISGYVKVGKKLEFQAGASVAFLLGSTGVGDWTYDGASERDNNPIDFVASLDHNYKSDELFKDDLDQLLSNEIATKFVADGETLVIPDQMGAYFDHKTKDGNFYNGIDVGIHAGISFYLSPGLFINFTANYGLLDATNDDFDFSRSETNGFERVPRTDVDHNINFQGSIGFSF